MIDHPPSPSPRSPFTSDSRPPLPFAGSERVDRVLSDLLADPNELVRWRDRCDRLLAAEGAGHLVHDLPVRADGRTAALESRPWRLDPIPLVLDTTVHGWLSAMVKERVRALEALLVDLHGDRELIRSGVVPPEALHGSGRYRSDAVGTSPTRWLTTYAIDLMQTADGVWHIVGDLTDAPVGLGYALLDRSVLSRTVPHLMSAHGVATLGRFPAAIRRALASVSEEESPRTVVFSGGIDHPSYIEQAYLAVQLGVHLVEGADLVVRQRRLWLRTLDGLEPIDVVYRRLEDRSIDPLEVASVGNVGVPGLLLAVRSGGVALANAHGSGVIEAESLRPHLDGALAAIASPTAAITQIGDRGAAPMPVPVMGDGGPTSAGVVLRMFAVVDDGSVTVLPGGSGRVLAPGDDPSLPTACLAKDVWVVGAKDPPTTSWRLPQVDLASSVPTRAADALHWMNRYAERAEVAARAMRTIDAAFDQDVALLTDDDSARVTSAERILSAVLRSDESAPRASDPASAIESAMAVAGGELVGTIGVMLTEATTVREYLSTTTGRVLEHLARLRGRFDLGAPDVDDLDAALADFAAIAGLWNEGTVRGPAWRLGDLGRRLERVAVVLDLVEAGLDASEDTAVDAGSPGAWTIEVVLASLESLVAYRRRYRSDVEADRAADLLIRDASNPRSVRAALEAVVAHARAAGWDEGERLAGEALGLLHLPTASCVAAVRPVVEEMSSGIVRRWFSAPVNPVPMAPTGWW